jgi:hypothetical protein
MSMTEANPRRVNAERLKDLFYLAIALVVVGMLVLALLWAWDWYRRPFLGLFVEPNLVISQIGAEDWPARQAGVQWSDRLRAVNGRPVANASELNAILDEMQPEANGLSPTVYPTAHLSIDRRAGGTYEVTVTPRHVELGELVAQFLIPYLVGWALLGSGFWVYRLSGDRRAARAFLLFTSALSVTTGAYLDINTTHHFALGWSLSLTIAAGSLGYLAMVFPKLLPFIDRLPWTRWLPWLVGCASGVDQYTPDAGAQRPVGVYPALDLGLGWRRWPSCSSGDAAGAHRFQQVAGHPPAERIIIFGAKRWLLGRCCCSRSRSLSQHPAFQSALYFPPFVFFLLAVAYAIVRYRLLDVDRFKPGDDVPADLGGGDADLLPGHRWHFAAAA